MVIMIIIMAAGEEHLICFKIPTMNALLPTIFSSLITGLIGWMLSNQKSNAEIKKLKVDTNSIELKNLSEMISLYKGISDDLRKEVENVKTQVVFLKNENHMLRREMMQLQKALKEQ